MEEVDGSVEIHVGLNGLNADRLVSRYRAAGCSEVRLDLVGVTSVEELVERVSAVFLFPYRISSLDAALDLMSDLEWLGSEVGYVVVIDGLSSLPGSVGARLLKVLPAVADRWRSQRRTFQIVILDELSRELTLAGLNLGNQMLAEAAQHAWTSDTGPVTLVEHARRRDGE